MYRAFFVRSNWFFCCMSQSLFSRRQFLTYAGGTAVVASLTPSIAFASYPDQPRTISMN
ncbi:twin-arginine translocation signal domain-containing protein, partial [Vibrio sp. 1F255]|uniref:twin-arginine translocation signal domain-containing protein n=1 Tax=Vibrio sp. 1F255 TaxID=3230009 RepID=UPI00352CA6C6